MSNALFWQAHSVELILRHCNSQTLLMSTSWATDKIQEACSLSDAQSVATIAWYSCTCQIQNKSPSQSCIDPTHPSVQGVRCRNAHALPCKHCCCSLQHSYRSCVATCTVAALSGGAAINEGFNPAIFKMCTKAYSQSTATAT